MISDIPQTRPVELSIKPSAISHNLARVRELVPGSRVMAVIKADGYGHGMEVAAGALRDAAQFAVTSLDDVFRLRQWGTDKPVVPLSPWLDSNALQRLRQHDLHAPRLTIFDQAQLEVLEQCDLPKRLCIWLKVDTGMGRTGFLPHQVAKVLRRLRKLNAIAEIGLLSHLANADAPDHPLNQIQIERFTELRDEYEFAGASLLNSGGVVGHSDHGADYVRPGVMLYGASPLLGTSAAELGLQPAQTLRSRLLSVKTLAAGTAVGYGSTVTLSRTSRIAYVACGYADGYPRHAPTGTPVLVSEHLVPLIGRVSMDILAVDLTDSPIEQAARVGDPVTLWGQGNPIENVARAAGTIAYELMCSPTTRVRRSLEN